MNAQNHPTGVMPKNIYNAVMHNKQKTTELANCSMVYLSLSASITKLNTINAIINGMD